MCPPTVEATLEPFVNRLESKDRAFDLELDLRESISFIVLVFEILSIDQALTLINVFHRLGQNINVNLEYQVLKQCSRILQCHDDCYEHFEH